MDADTPEQVTARVGELVAAMLERNGLSTGDLISLLFTATPDITSTYPATAARAALGLDSVPLLGAQELAVQGGVPRCIRVMAHVETDRPAAEIRHVYLEGARHIRHDLAQ